MSTIQTRAYSATPSNMWECREQLSTAKTMQSKDGAESFLSFGCRSVRAISACVCDFCDLCAHRIASIFHRNVQQSLRTETAQQPVSRLFDLHQREFQAMNDTPEASGFVRWFNRGPKELFTNLICLLFSIEKKDLAWEFQVSAEHMSYGSLAGTGSIENENTITGALRKTLCSLQRQQRPHKDLIQALQYELRINEQLSAFRKELAASYKQNRKILSYDTTPLVKQVMQKIEELSPGQSIAVPVEAEMHFMCMMITCSHESAGGEKKYSITLHNTGAGVENYHYRVSENGKLKFQRVMEITDIPVESLCGKESTFFSKIFSANIVESGNAGQQWTIEKPKVERFYEEFLPLLKGKLAPQSSNPRLWGHLQRGESCCPSSILSLVRYQMPDKEFKELMESIRIETVLRSCHEIKQGVPRHDNQKQVTLEVVKKLQRSYEKQGLSSPKELFETQKQLLERNRNCPVLILLPTASSRRVSLKPLVEVESPYLESLKRHDENFWVTALKAIASIQRSSQGIAKIHGYYSVDIIEDTDGAIYGKGAIDNLLLAYTIFMDEDASQEALSIAYMCFEKASNLITSDPSPLSSGKFCEFVNFFKYMGSIGYSTKQLYAVTAISSLFFYIYHRGESVRNAFSSDVEKILKNCGLYHWLWRTTKLEKCTPRPLFDAQIQKISEKVVGGFIRNCSMKFELFQQKMTLQSL
jgi:hypothetical protein